MDNKNNMDECMWMIMGSIHESDRITVAKCLDMMEEKGISKKEMISIIENAKVELFHVYNEKICSVIDGLDITGLTSILGSKRPVGLIICSTTLSLLCSFS